MNNPYLSFIIVGRNDNYGVNFLERINTFIKSLDWQTQRYPNVFELVVVEWNPLSENSSLAEVLHKPKNLAVRVITVPSKLHSQFNAKIPVLEFCGKNVGIRRANGKFVLITNPDILFSQELIDEIAKQNLDENHFYRTDRHDYDGTGITKLEEKDYIPFAVSKTFISNLEGSSVSAVETSCLENLPKSKLIWYHFNGCGDFILAARNKFFDCDGLWEATHQKWHMDSYSLCRLVGLGLKQHTFVAPKCIFHMDHPRNPPDANWNGEMVTMLFHNLRVFDSENQKNWGLKGFVLSEVKL